ncbi:polysaccharide deacetylase family protein [Nocardioides mangrovicus]|uniref:polysaccharide deacetylase family protein n=1 Tax=Nocardioides mangrovicus TaxID=2478913 RepID=UPI001314AD7D|nr:polysaccharide deacetylase family protein [Nocardioides mangrovicus]
MRSPVMLLATGLLTASVLCVPTASSAVPAGCPTPKPGYVHRAPRALGPTGAPTPEKTVALTFDDGPSRFTPRILAVLRRFGVRATFFETGLHVSEHPGLTRRVVAEGHLLGNHTWHHEYPENVKGGWSAAYLEHELRSTGRLQRRLAGRATCFMRPPGGNKSPALLPTAHALGMSVVMWSVGTDDWDGPPQHSRSWVHTIVRNAAVGLQQRHPIVLLHDGKASHEPGSVVSSYRGNTVAALPRIIEMYQRAGYTFVGLDGLSGLPEPAPSGVATP